MILIIFLLAFALITVLILFILKNRLSNDLLYELNEHKEHLTQLNKLRDSMLEITQAVIGTEDPKDLYAMILDKAVDAIPNANVGSVLIRGDDGIFRFSAQKGFDDDKLSDLSLPLEETILWKYTKGDIHKTEIIDDVLKILDLNILPVTVDSEEWLIRSSIIVPFFHDKKIFGILHIDSKEVNAFTKEDKKAMEYIRGNLEVALQKYMLFTRMVNLSRFDGLTGVYNRTYFMDQFHNLLNNAERYKQTFTLVIFDINDLKKTNDSIGHLAGDAILKSFSQTTMKIIRKTDIFSRWGGDEFMGLFYQISKEEIDEKIQIIRKNLDDNPLVLEKHTISPQFSSGFAQYPEEGTDFDTLLKIADDKMYKNKKAMKSEPHE